MPQMRVGDLQIIGLTCGLVHGTAEVFQQAQEAHHADTIGDGIACARGVPDHGCYRSMGTVSDAR